MPRNKQMRITRRLVNTKRHTTGYVIGGKKTSVPQARRLASQGRLANVRVVGRHIQSVPGKTRLSDLPTTVVN
jgi:hypothetical protein